MNQKTSLIELPFVEAWLFPAIFVLIVGLLALLDSQPSCAANCPCIGRTQVNPPTPFSGMRHRQLMNSGPNRKPTRTPRSCIRFPGDATTPLAGQGNFALNVLFASTGRTVLFMTTLGLSSCGVFYAFPPAGVSGKLQTL